MRRRGFTLVEALLTLVVVAAVFGLLADLMRSQSRLMSFTASNREKIQAAQTAMSKMRSDLSQAVSLVTPTSPTPAARITLITIAPDFDRFPSPAPAGIWFPHEPASRVTIDYEVVNQELIRTVTSPGGPAISSQLGGNLDTLVARLSQPDLISVDLTTQPASAGGSVTLTAEVFLRLPTELQP